MLDASSEPIILPVVTPQTGDPSTSGRVRNLPVSPQAIPAWLERRKDGRYVVRGEYAERGYVKLEDLYAAEHNPEGWAKYQRYLVGWKAGTVRVSFPLAALPEEVRKRQTTLVDDEFGDEFSSPPKPTTGDAHPLPVAKPKKGGGE